MRDQQLLERARGMRTEPTAPELRLWYALRADRLDGAKFRRQVVIGRYIVDFACRSPIKVIVEADGDTHSAQEDYDAERTAYLQSQGYIVLRFSNREIMTNLEGVLLTIQNTLRTPPLPDPLP